MDGTGDGEIGVCNSSSSGNLKFQISPRSGNIWNKENN